MITKKEASRVNKKIFTAPDWVKEYGIPHYGVRSTSFIDKYPEQILPDSWEVIRKRNYHYVYLCKQKEESLRPVRKVSHIDRMKIQDTDFRRRGALKRLAKELRLSESTISRVNRGIYGSEISELSRIRKKNLYVDRSDVVKFFASCDVAEDWLRKVGENRKVVNLKNVYELLNRKRRPSWFSKKYYTLRKGRVWFIFERL